MATNSQTSGRGKRQGGRQVVEVPQMDAFGNKQPQQLDFEAAVLGALLIEQESYEQVSNLLTPESFYDHRHQIIFKAIQSLQMNQRPVDVVTVPQYLESQGELEDAGGVIYIAQLTQNVITSAHIEYQAQIIHQKYQARKLITFASKVLGDAFDPTKDVADLMQETEAELYTISQQTQKTSYTQINPVIDEAMKKLHEAMARTDGLSGISTGFTKLDKVTNGWQNSDLVIIAARPAMGKTAFILSMMKRMAVDARIPVAMFSLEMANVQLVNRLIVNVCDIPGEKLKSGQLSPVELGQLDARLNRLIDAPIYVDDTASLSIFELRTKARRLVRDHGVKIILIDYLQLMNASGMNFGSRQEEVSTISRNLKGLAKELNIPIIALSQLNRGLENREGNEGKRPQLSDLRESGAIEQDADMVCFIHRPEYYKIDTLEGVPMKGVAEFIIAKHRNGPTDIIRMKFKNQYARFEDYEDNGPAPMPGEQYPGASMKVSEMSPEEAASISNMALNMPEGGAGDAPGSSPFGPSDPVDDNPPF
ncbi:MAG: replicative DNA helicase [Bacteroidaceae bacterium]|nr:replicative DNA helicase [Bacteroidaceae bacterium]